MNIYIFTEEEPLFTHKILHYLFRLKKNHNIILIITKTNLKFRRILSLFLIFRLKNFIFYTYKYLMNIFFWRNINKLANMYDIKVKNIKSVNSDKLLNIIEGKNNVLLSINCSQIFKKKLLNKFKKKINLHLGQLPNYRGLFPIFFAILNREKHIKATLHVINDKIDDGNTISELNIKVTKNNVFYMYKEVYQKIAKKVAIKFYQLIHVNNTYKNKKNKLKRNKYYSYPNLKQILEYYKIYE